MKMSQAKWLARILALHLTNAGDRRYSILQVAGFHFSNRRSLQAQF